MVANYSYFDYDRSPCRIAVDKDASIQAEVYVSGKGFVETSKMTILLEAQPISKAEFEKMIVALTRKARTGNS